MASLIPATFQPDSSLRKRSPFQFPTLVITLTFIGLFLLAVSLNEYIDPRSWLNRMGGGSG